MDKTNLLLPQITLDRLLQLEVEEVGGIIVPMSINTQAPLQPNEEFYVGEEFVYHFEPRTQICGDIYYKNEEPDIMSNWTEASQMPPEHSRFHGVCVDVKVKKANDIPFHMYTNKNSHRYIEYAWKEFVHQHNSIHSTTIEPSLDDNVFLITIRRTK